MSMVATLVSAALLLASSVLPAAGNETATDDAAGNDTVTNLAAGRVPSGSSDSPGARFSAATDSSTELGHWWRPASAEHPSYLSLDLGALAIVSSMTITTGEPGFSTLRIYRSNETQTWQRSGDPAVAWIPVRLESTLAHCAAGGNTTEHAGWPEATRHVIVQLDDRCTDAPIALSIAEWRVFGAYEAGMVKKYDRSWPHCPIISCFDYTALDDAKTTCLAEHACDGFSFSAGSINGGFGQGCYKTNCTGSVEDGNFELGRGRLGHWEKRTGPTASDAYWE